MAFTATAAASAPGGARHNPLAVSYPSPTLLLHYPLFATNVKVLCDRSDWRNRKQSSLAATINALRGTYQAEGALGLYRGGHLYLLHQGARDLLRLVADALIGLVERGLRPRRLAEPETEPEAELRSGAEEDQKQSKWVYRLRMVTKYAIDAACYPILLASTRAILLHGDNQGTVQRMRLWSSKEGLPSLWSGLLASLLSTALDEAMDVVLAWCIEYCSAETDVDVADRLLLKASGSSVVSIFTAPINYVGVIQRCQSNVPGLLEPSPLSEAVASLPWRSSAYQLVMFGGIMALNVRLIQWKTELGNEDYEDRNAAYPSYQDYRRPEDPPSEPE